MPIITVEKAEHLCSMLRAMAAGKTVQYKQYTGIWEDKDDCHLFSNTEYRIKPEPVLLHYRNYLVVVGGASRNMYCASFRSDSQFTTKDNATYVTEALLNFDSWIGDWQSIELKE